MYLVVAVLIIHFLLSFLISRAEVARLQRVVELKTREMNKVKRLAKNILDQVDYEQTPASLTSIVKM